MKRILRFVYLACYWTFEIFPVFGYYQLSDPEQVQAFVWIDASISLKLLGLEWLGYLVVYV